MFEDFPGNVNTSFLDRDGRPSSTPVIDVRENAHYPQILEYGKRLSSLAEELQGFVHTSKSRSPNKGPQPAKGKLRSVITTSPGKSVSRSRSREAKQLIEKIDSIRTNLEVEGKTLQGYYKRLESEREKQVRQSDKETMSQLRTANRILKKQARDVNQK